MRRHSLDRIAAQHLLEAIKAGQSQLSKIKMEAVELGTTNPKDLMQTYSRVRQLRDHIQRCISANPTWVNLELEDDDSNLVASCLLHDLGGIDHQPKGQMRPADEEWLSERIDLLTKWILRLATRPLVELPRRPGKAPSRVRDMIMQVRDRLETKSEDATSFIVAGGMQAPPEGPPPSAPAVPGPIPIEDVAQGSIEDSPLRVPDRIEMPEHTPERGGQIDPHLIRDPRLRSMMTLDLRAYARAIKAEDYRLAAIHLASVLEGAVLDHAMPRVRDLGLSGPPDSWKLNKILTVVMTDFSAHDRALLAHLMGTMNMIRPSTQLGQPVVVTKKILEEMRGFVQRILGILGLLGSPRPAAT